MDQTRQAKPFRVPLTLTADDVDRLVGDAIVFGYLRIEPRRRWTDAERREAVAFALQRQIEARRP
jgi:transposase-like protein